MNLKTSEHTSVGLLYSVNNGTSKSDDLIEDIKYTKLSVIGKYIFKSN